MKTVAAMKMIAEKLGYKTVVALETDKIKVRMSNMEDKTLIKYLQMNELNAELQKFGRTLLAQHNILLFKRK